LCTTPLQDSSSALMGRFAARVRKPVSLPGMDQAIAYQATQGLNNAKT
jgi:hypothetical protein